MLFTTWAVLVSLQMTDDERVGPLRPLIELILADWFRPYYLVIKWPFMILILMLIARACEREVESAERKKYRKEHVDKIAQLQERQTIYREHRNQDDTEHDSTQPTEQHADTSTTNAQE